MIQPSEEMLDQLEPVVTRIARPLLLSKIAAGESTVNAETTAALFSQAISLKRIADQGDRIVAALETLAGELAHPEYGVAPAIRQAARGPA